MPGKVIRCDVENQSHVGRERARGGELVGRHLGHVDVEMLIGYGIDAGVADVAHRSSGKPGALEHMLDHRRGGGFSVSARDGDPAGIRCAFAPCELDLADDLGTYRSGVQIKVAELGDAGAGNAEVVRLGEDLGIEGDDSSTGNRLGSPCLSGIVSLSSGDMKSLDASAQQIKEIARNGLAADSKTKHKNTPELGARVLSSFKERNIGHDWLPLPCSACVAKAPTRREAPRTLFVYEAFSFNPIRLPAKDAQGKKHLGITTDTWRTTSEHARFAG